MEEADGFVISCRAGCHYSGCIFEDPGRNEAMLYVGRSSGLGFLFLFSISISIVGELLGWVLVTTSAGCWIIVTYIPDHHSISPITDTQARIQWQHEVFSLHIGVWMLFL